MNRMFRQRKYDTRRIDRQYAEETDVYVMLYNSYADALYAYGMGFGFDNERSRMSSTTYSSTL